MKKNMGTIDRLVRVVVALLLAVLIIQGVINGIWAVVLGVVAGVFLITSILAFCPLYTIFGIHTLRCRVGNDD